MSKRKNIGWSKRIDSKLDKAWAVIRKAEAYTSRRAAAALRDRQLIAREEQMRAEAMNS
jgi:hypothetical protein